MSANQDVQNGPAPRQQAPFSRSKAKQAHLPGPCLHVLPGPQLQAKDQLQWLMLPRTAQRETSGQEVRIGRQRFWGNEEMPEDG